jgi:hypothetical protein
MPTKLQVKVNTVTHTEQNGYNYVQVTGLDHTNNKGFKKRFFATKKDGSATKNAETADSLSKDDWVEFTLDDTSYKNVQSLKKIGAPADAGSVPSQGGNSGGGRSSGGSDKMSKADWAAKDANKERSMARHKALVVATDYCIAAGLKKGKDNVAGILDVAARFEEYLNPSSKQPGDEKATVTTTASVATEVETTPVQDDDIPF